jgi:Tat protein secretion system quality control protein TatD with DNase activity
MSIDHGSIIEGLQMNNFVPIFIDSHVHLDHMVEDNPDRIEWLKNNGCVTVSWALSINLESLQDLKHYLKAQAGLIQKLNKKGLPCYFLTGIHPEISFQANEGTRCGKYSCAVFGKSLLFGFG